MAKNYNNDISASTCIDYGNDCRGPVEFHAVGSAPYAWPRCTLHAARSQRVYGRIWKYEETQDVEIQDRRTGERY